MALNSVLKGAGKVVAGALVYYVGFLLGSMVAGVMGMEAPPLPAGTDAQTLGMYQLVVSLFFALTLAMLSRRLAGARGLFSLGGWRWRCSVGWLTVSTPTWRQPSLPPTARRRPTHW